MQLRSTNTIPSLQKLKPGVVRPVILANGIKLHVQPQNLVLAANLAGVSRINNQVSNDLRLLLTTF